MRSSPLQEPMQLVHTSLCPPPPIHTHTAATLEILLNPQIKTGLDQAILMSNSPVVLRDRDLKSSSNRIKQIGSSYLDEQFPSRFAGRNVDLGLAHTRG